MYATAAQTGDITIIIKNYKKAVYREKTRNKKKTEENIEKVNINLY